MRIVEYRTQPGVGWWRCVVVTVCGGGGRVGGVVLNFMGKFLRGVATRLEFLGGVMVGVRGLRGVRVWALCISKVAKNPSTLGCGRGGVLRVNP